MSEETWTAEELFEGLTLQEGFIAELEKFGLLRVVARDGQGGRLYSADAREELEKVLTLMELGYEPRDIAAIAQRVGLPAKRRGLFRRVPVRMRIPELARRTRVEASRIEAWAKSGRLSVALVSDGGSDLYGSEMLDRVRLIADLEDAGVVSADIDRVLHMMGATADGAAPDPEANPATENADAHAFIVGIRRRIAAQKTAIRRLDRGLSALEKRLKRSMRAKEPKRGRRLGRARRVRTASAGRKGPGSSVDHD